MLVIGIICSKLSSLRSSPPPSALPSFALPHPSLIEVTKIPQPVDGVQCHGTFFLCGHSLALGTLAVARNLGKVGALSLLDYENFVNIDTLGIWVVLRRLVWRGVVIFTIRTSSRNAGDVDKSFAFQYKAN